MSMDIRYHFGPRDRRGVLLGIRLGQIAILATGAFAGMVVLLGARGSAGGLLALLLVVGLTATLAFVPISGRALDEWLPAFVHFLLHGKRMWRSPQPRRGRVLRSAFRYDWRLWTLPELTYLMLQAGFTRAEVWCDAYDPRRRRSDGIYRPRKHMPAREDWVAYVIAVR